MELLGNGGLDIPWDGYYRRLMVQAIGFAGELCQGILCRTGEGGNADSAPSPLPCAIPRILAPTAAPIVASSDCAPGEAYSAVSGSSGASAPNHFW